MSKWVSQALYDVRLAGVDEDRLAAIDKDATVVFVMNHRSNMDYLLVTWLVAERSALSYAVGEWARIWPLSTLIRSMGAFFIRRRSRSPLYRKVLSRYVQMATAGGVTQAVFPEGGLSLDGRIARPKLGFLSYIVTGFDPDARDVVFVPVALNYDRVLEDRVLIEADRSGQRKFRASIPTAVRFALRQLGRRLRGRFRKFGTAAVAFGEPLSLATFSKNHPTRMTEALGAELRERLCASVPALPVPLVALALEQASGPVPRKALVARVGEITARLEDRELLEQGPEAMVTSALENLMLRRLVRENEAGIEAIDDEHPLLTYYANSVRHLVPYPVRVAGEDQASTDR